MNSSRILVVDDESDIRRLLQEILTEEGYEVEVAADAGQARAARARHTPDLVLLDIWMPDTDGITLLREWSADANDGCPVVMMSGHGTVETAVEATRLGAYDFVEKPLSLAKLLRTVERALDARRRPPAKFLPAAGAIPAGRSRVMQQLRAELQRAAAHSAPLLLLGESGTDREALARYVHQLGAARNQPFVVLDSRTLREETAAAMLLGTDTANPGVFEQAGRGTLFLNDIEDLPQAAQRLLGGVLDAGRYARASTGETVALEARIVSAARPAIVTHVLGELFRRDLYAQLSVLLVRVPPLRDYAEDVPELLRHCVDVLTETEGLRFRRFSVAAQNRLRNYPWPDNERELRNLTRRFLLGEGSEEITLDEVERELSAQTPPDEPLVKHDLLALPLREAREHFERAYLQQQLLLCNGKVGLLAKRVDMERTHLYRKLRSLGIEIGHGAEE
ncbi:MAG: sigma-54-dependent transcriptional regulator [Steroidobacterales bacterium]